MSRILHKSNFTDLTKYLQNPPYQGKARKISFFPSFFFSDLKILKLSHKVTLGDSLRDKNHLEAPINTGDVISITRLDAHRERRLNKK